MTAKVEKQKMQIVRTSVLTIDWGNIDWETVNQNFCIVRYELPHYLDGPGSFGKLHNWFKSQCDRPYYLNTHGPTLYVKYQSPNQIEDFYYEKQKLSHALVDIQNNKDDFHAVFKALVSDYFEAHENFVSSANFFLRVSPAEKDFITVIKVHFSQDWRHNRLNDFVATSEATRLRKLTPLEVNELQASPNKIYYGLLYRGDIAYFRQLKLASIDEAQKKRGVFIEYRNQQKRANIVFHSVKSVRDLERSRSYLLNQLLSNLIKHFNDLGLPFKQKLFDMEQVATKSGKQMKQRQLPKSDRVIYVVDGRLQPADPENIFLDQFCTFINDFFKADQVTFTSASAENLCFGDWVLRIQDFDAEDLLPGGILEGRTDQKNEFYLSFPHLVKQTLNINPNSDEKNSEEQQSFSAIDYLSYDIEQVKKEQGALFQRLTVCHNQLFLKDLIQNPGNLLGRLPILEKLQNKVFMAYGAFVYSVGKELRFVRIDNDELERGAKILYEITGKRLLEDVLEPSRNLNYFKPEAKKREEDVKKRKFIISKDYVLEIVDSDIRMLYEDQEIRARLLKQENPLPKESFYPIYSASESSIFTQTQLQLFTEFLDDYVAEAYLSYKDLKANYGKEIRNRADTLADGTGFYNILGIKSDLKLKKYYEQHLGLVFESVRDQSVIPVYQGIWYQPDEQLYLVGSKDGVDLEQARGFIYREIECHDWKFSKENLKAFLVSDILPLLEVNFIRHNNYTVYPFPFNLIQIWLDLEKWNIRSLQAKN